MKPLDPVGVDLMGTRLVEASAGTGKTHTITTLYLRLLLERRLEVGQILVVTYTKAATAELRDRIRGRLVAAASALERGGAPGDAALDALIRSRLAADGAAGDRERLAAAVCGFDEAAVFTIHGFCQRMLRDHAFESGALFDTELAPDWDALFTEVVSDFWTREVYAAPLPFVRFLGRKKVDPDSLVPLARMVVASPGMEVLPECRQVDLEAALAEWRRAYESAAASFRTERDQILSLLADGDELNRSSYKAEKIRGDWGPFLDVALSEGSPGVLLGWKQFENFTPSVLAKRTKKGKLTPEHLFFELCQSLLEAEERLEEVFGQRLLKLQLDLVDYARSELERRKRAGNSQSYDDLLQRLAGALCSEGGEQLAARIRDRFRAALIDEFQDTDPIQYQIFDRVWHADPSHEVTMFLIGDPKQAIYAFRGADVFAYMDAKRDAAGECFGIGTNWRSDPGLVGALNRLFGGAAEPFVFDAIPFEPVEAPTDARDGLSGALAGRAPLQILFASRSSERVGKRSPDRIISAWSGDGLLGLVAAELARLLASGARVGGEPVEPGDIAILCRTNRQARSLQPRLRELGIPSVLLSDESVFESEDATELARVLAAAADPTDAVARRVALATSIMGIDGQKLLALESDEAAWEAWGQRFRSWNRVWLEQGFIQALRRLLDEHRVPRLLLVRRDGERRLTNLLHLGELLQEAAQSGHLGPLGLLGWLARMRRDPVARVGVAESAQIRLESDARAVKLVTVHKSKGLEYKVVYCPFLWHGGGLSREDERWLRFHAGDGARDFKLDLGSPDRAAHLECARREALAESLRLTYVALTRARHRCSLVWGAFARAETSPLAYLLHQPKGVSAGADLAELTAKRFDGLEDAQIRAELEALASRSAGSIEVAELDLSPAPVYRITSGVEAGALQARRARRRLGSGWRTSSFSGLISAGAPSPGEVGFRGDALASEGRDYDSAAEAPAGGLATTLAGAAAASTEGAVGDEQRVRLHDFPAGATAGSLLHEIFQYTDFQEPAEGGAFPLEDRVEKVLDRYGFDLAWSHVVSEALREVLATPLEAAEDAICLARVSRQRRLDEMEFALPVSERAPLAPAGMAEVFARNAQSQLTADYAARVARLGFAPVAGYLKGFIDLVFELEGRFYVVDYKSNRLGSAPGDYAPPRLAAPMAEHHYILQYHLYLVALHRYLGLRFAGYDYDRHLGGAYYLFVRGMSPAHPAGCGVFFDRPARELIEGLSDLLAGNASGDDSESRGEGE